MSENEKGRGASIIAGFTCMGLLIGYIVGITDSEISKTIIAALFAFIGGRVFFGFER